MRKNLRNLFWVWEFEKEEKWLAHMAAQGLALVAVGYCRYEFEPCTPGEYAVRLELLEHAPTHPESQQYISFMEETGVEYIGHMMRWAYFRKKTADGPFDLFSDIASRIRHLKRIVSLLIPLMLANTCAGLYNVTIYQTVARDFTNINFYAALVSLICSLLMCYGIFRIVHARAKLEKEQQIFE